MTTFKVAKLDDFTVRVANERDVEPITNMLKAAARSLHEKEIKQWGYLLQGGEDEEIKADISAGKTYIVETGSGEPVASFNFTNVQNEWDIDMWGKRQENAFYIHRFVVNLTHQHRQLGGRLLQWIDENHTIQDGYIRLDCVANNPVLNAFYQKAGFQFAGYVGDGDDRFSLYEKVIKVTA
ncbi:GNAT family N-acetyltransferase [Ornithinibacillus contaminans]|uniref:GNAT family N-acetyltransferase n=1 Tax=Ornithinibacillus contaminans TaxID=694055 RepID=UPI00064D82B0|nr:GNAT family N-acetyltransferase [Ornithinibacillus contaminans]